MVLAPQLQPLPAVSGTASVAGRVVDYLRISVTDRCNERCLYCLPEQRQEWLPRSEVLSYEEILELVQVSVERGFRHFRVTGGEPLLRRDLPLFLRELIALPGVETVQVTTNGTRLGELGPDLQRSGLRRINVSLDALDPQKYRDITRGDIAPVLAGLRQARELGFEIKLNTVLIRHRNETELLPLVRFATELGAPIRFIELMPVSLTEMLSEQNFLPVGEVMDLLAREERLVPLKQKLGHGPAAYYRMEKLGATVGFIGALTNLHFCDACNKIRLTADGFIRPCLGNHGEIDLKPALRPSVQRADIHLLFNRALQEKPAEHLFRQNWQPGRIMTAIGG